MGKGSSLKIIKLYDKFLSPCLTLVIHQLQIRARSTSSKDEHHKDGQQYNVTEETGQG